jgi:hypothetical protein
LPIQRVDEIAAHTSGMKLKQRKRGFVLLRWGYSDERVKKDSVGGDGIEVI